MIKDDLQVIQRTLATLDPEDRAAALHVLQRESLSEAPEVSSPGKKEEPLEKDSRRAMDEEVSTLSPAVQGLTVEYLVSLIVRKELSQNNAALEVALRRGITEERTHDDAKPT